MEPSESFMERIIIASGVAKTSQEAQKILVGIAVILFIITAGIIITRAQGPERGPSRPATASEIKAMQKTAEKYQFKK